MKIQSPWLYNQNHQPTFETIHNPAQTEIAIVGGGIAGLSTAYFLLQQTQYTVTLIEASTIASGATGHNGGFLATYFERSFHNLVAEYGLEKTAAAQAQIETSWDLLKEMHETAGLQTPYWIFTGAAGCQHIAEIESHLQSNSLRAQAKLPNGEILLTAESAARIPNLQNFSGVYRIETQETILDYLETTDRRYIGAVREQKGCMNSAAFCQELVQYLHRTYKQRFTVYEQTPVKVIHTHAHTVILETRQAPITAKKVVLCTNGFENFKLVNKNGQDIDTAFHHDVRGIVGYMAAYVEHSEKRPIEISYLPKYAHPNRSVFEEEPYFYLTRRPFKYNNEIQSLISIGGPELLTPDSSTYSQQHPYSEEAKKEIAEFLRQTYRHAPENVDFQFLWHGLMGFTPNGIRLIGEEPRNPLLLYNLGCNGVGLLPSLYGGKRIAEICSGKKLAPSLFDPQ